MRKVLLACGIFLVSYSVQAQHPGYDLLKDDAAFKTQFKEASQKINSIRSDFVQEKNLSLLDDRIISKGKFWFRKENAVRMEYTSPFLYLMIVNGTDVYIRDSKKENRLSSRSNKLFQQINRIMIDCVNGNALESKDFTVKIFTGGDGFLAELTPVEKALKTMFRNVNIIIDKKDLSVSRVEMHEPSGDNTIIRFVNREMNVNLSDALFAAR
ncbi:MAG: outer membrane lipoprotein carrier protein LolA [Chitinophagaceae bacterium]|nr:outer membrane lipoprotein carrier protein LolA [Chitinophagaceae bacterium]MCW5927166.1 outer membrane lipoprotein carrier protein LolA [Chitinophagaceae bacterium]